MKLNFHIITFLAFALLMTSCSTINDSNNGHKTNTNNVSENNQASLKIDVVKNLTEDEGHVSVEFTKHAAIYYLQKKHPEYDNYLKILEESLASGNEVIFDYSVNGQEITILEAKS